MGITGGFGVLKRNSLGVGTNLVLMILLVNASFIPWFSCVFLRTRDLTEVLSSLSQTSALYVFYDYVVFSLVYGQRNTNRT